MAIVFTFSREDFCLTNDVERYHNRCFGEEDASLKNLGGFRRLLGTSSVQVPSVIHQARRDSKLYPSFLQRLSVPIEFISPSNL